jgi:O-antigen/teichoic acid export membrane protein
MIGRIVGYVVTFVMPITLVRLFSPAEFGTYKQVFLIYGTLVGVGQIGMAESLYYFIPRAPENAGRYVSNTILMLAVSGLLLLGISWFGAAHVARWWSNPGLVAFLPILGVSILFGLTSIAFETVLVSQNKYASAAVLYGATDFSRAVILVGAAVITRDLRWLLVGSVVYGALRCVTMAVYLVRRFGPELRPDARLWKQQLQYAVPFTIAGWVSVNPQGFLVASWVDSATFAIYAVGCLNVPIVDVVASAFGNVLMVKLGEHIRHGRPVAALWHQTNQRLQLICLPLTAALFLTAPELFAVLFPSAYSASVPVFRVFVFLIPVGIVPVDATLRSYAENRTLLMLNLTKTALGVGLLYWLFATLGLPGVVLASLIAISTVKAIAVLRIGRLMGLGLTALLPWRALGKIVAATLIATVPAVIVRAQLLPLHPLLLGAITTLVYALAYIPTAAVFGLLPDLTLWPRWRLAANSEGK